MCSALTFLLLAPLVHLLALDIDLDPQFAGHVYDGHGALSAGASSRLLYDYQEPYRTQILDLLFSKAKGAALHLLKVEIGGDSQSTDGTEPSHMHERNDLVCGRGYEFWLMQEARKRNPEIKLFALSWAVPYWIGNQTGYYCQDNIDYHISWLQCTQKLGGIGNIDYIGNWNERSWGPPEWTKQFRKALDSNGFQNTRIVIPDGWLRGANDTLLQTLDTDAEFAAAVDGIGLHYPCDVPLPDVQLKYNKKYWSSEDYSTEADWAGAGCWGRILNQNFVRMNMTSTIAWSLIWSVYPKWPYFGNGLMYAFEPWSGHYEVNAPIWTTAHTTQFTRVGWQYLDVGKGSGSLQKGGSYVTLMAPDATDFTVVVEKLEGKCLRCAGDVTQAETVTFKLVGKLQRQGPLSLWITNSTSQFVRLADLVVNANTFSLVALPDSIYTISSTNGQEKAGFGTPPPSKPFPIPYSDDFDSYDFEALAKYFSDDGGSFAVASAPDRNGKVLKQVVRHPAAVNGWAADTEPISVIGDDGWKDFSVSVDVLGENLPQQEYAHIRSLFTHQCFDLPGRSTQEGGAVDAYTCVYQDNELFRFDSTSGQIVAQSDGKCVSAGPCAAGVQGLCQTTCSQQNAANQSWAFGEDNTLRLRSDQSRCVETASQPKLDALVSLTPCTKPPKASQTWEYGDSGYAGVCVRMSQAGDRDRQGYCLNLYRSGLWQLLSQTTVLQAGQAKAQPGWTRLTVSARNTTITAAVNGSTVASVQDTAFQNGMACIQSSWGQANFDNFAMDN